MLAVIDLSFFGPLGQFLGGMAAFITVASGLAVWLFKWMRGTKQELIEATTANMQRMIAANLQATCEIMAAKDFHTLDVHFQNGCSVIIPMFPFREMLVSENIRMCVIDHTTEKTTMLLRCQGFGHIPPHHHDKACEMLEIRTGWVTHIETGRRYGPGDVWQIEKGEVHSATFQDCCVIITHRPPLPNGEEQPVNLKAYQRIP
jgi:hypothetical protein